MNKAIFTLSLCVFSAVLPGCIAWEIRDGVRETNQHLTELKPTLVHTLRSVDETNREIGETQSQLTDVQTSLAQTRSQLAEVQAALAQTHSQLTTLHASLSRTDEHLVAVSGTLVQTNPKLGEMQGELERMRILNDVHAKLTEVNKALGPLSTAMGSLGGAMSWLGVSEGGDDLLDEEAAAPSTGAAPAGAGAEPAAAASSGAEADSADPNAAKRSDPLHGTWVMVYPPPAAPGSTAAGTAATPSTLGRITVIMANGSLLFAEAGNPIRTGRWSRQGRTLTFTLDPLTPGGQPETASGELLTLNSRTLTIRRGDIVTVHARP